MTDTVEQRIAKKTLEAREALLDLAIKHAKEARSATSTIASDERNASLAAAMFTAASIRTIDVPPISGATRSVDTPPISG
jgi:hypothetical protein